MPSLLGLWKDTCGSLSVSMFPICPPVCLEVPSHVSPACPASDEHSNTLHMSIKGTASWPNSQFCVLKASFPPENSRLCMSSLEPHPPLCPSQILTCSMCVRSAVASLLLDCWAGVSACLIAGPGKLLKALHTCVLRSTGLRNSFSPRGRYFC